MRKRSGHAGLRPASTAVVDIRTLFLAQTCLLVVAAAMLWAARGGADRRNGLRAWTVSITFEGVAYLVLGYTAGVSPVVTWLAGMVAVVTIVGGVTNVHVAGAAIFNGFVYGALEFLNAHALWRAARPLK